MRTHEFVVYIDAEALEPREVDDLLRRGLGEAFIESDYRDTYEG